MWNLKHFEWQQEMCLCLQDIHSIYVENKNTQPCLCILSSTLETDGGFCSLFFYLQAVPMVRSCVLFYFESCVHRKGGRKWQLHEQTGCAKSGAVLVKPTGSSGCINKSQRPTPITDREQHGGHLKTCSIFSYHSTQPVCEITTLKWLQSWKHKTLLLNAMVSKARTQDVISDHILSGQDLRHHFWVWQCLFKLRRCWLANFPLFLTEVASVSRPYAKL